MIDWSPAVKRLGYDNEDQMWRDLYLVRGLSISQLSKKLDVSRNTIRNTLDRLKIDIRSQGGANNQKLTITDELIEDVRLNGVTAVALKMKVQYSTLYKRLYRCRGLTIADLREAEKAEQASGESADKPIVE